MRTSPMTLKALALLTASVGLAACNDISTPSSRTPPTPPGVAETPKTPKTPEVPAPVATTPPTMPVTPEMKKDELIASKNLPKIVSKEDEDSDAIENASLTELLSRTRDALSAGDSERALKLAANAVKKAPKRSAPWNLLGRAQLLAGKRKLALDSFEKAVELNPNNSYAQNNLGLTLIYAGRYDDAIEALEEATQHDPVEGFMWNNLGIAYEHGDRLDDAREAFRKGADMENDNARDSLARLQGVKSLIRTAKVDSEPKTKGGKSPTPLTVPDKLDTTEPSASPTTP
jgi:tetratricopeptide (TPR) repeat protein